MIREYIKLFRVYQWIKNSFVFVPLIFSKHLFDLNYFVTSVIAFFVFCIASSIIYIINDVVDIEADRAHPLKRDRPLASGKISKNNALFSALILIVPLLLLLLLFNLKFIIILSVFITINIAYSFSLKNIVLIDVFTIAAGFMLRVIGGAFAINVEISSWLLLTTMFISLFLAVMKRRSELKHIINDEGASQRKVLAYYSTNFADQMATVAAAAVIICYALYTVAERTVNAFGTEDLIFTTPFVVFGIFRYMYLVYMVKKGENSSELVIRDFPMLLNILLYILTTTLIIYSTKF
jgi:4-hydroxybenzoate polyprenyltransferase